MHKFSKAVICVILISSLFSCHLFIHASHKVNNNINLEDIIPRYQITSNSLDNLIRTNFNFQDVKKGLNNSRLLNNALMTNTKYRPVFYFPLTRQTIRVSNNLFNHRFMTRDIDYRQRLNHAWYKTNLNYLLTPHTLTLTKHTYLLPKLFKHSSYYELNNKDGYIKGIPLGINSVSYKIHSRKRNKLVLFPYAYKNENNNFIHITSKEQAKHRLVLYLSQKQNDNLYAPSEITNNIHNKSNINTHYDTQPTRYFN